ncbi:MAG: hypothetical protein GY934_13410 [Gammaproteobacteria bacterium]|nr:hypothetical protein [Gammaproteobacteria bacterium]
MMTTEARRDIHRPSAINVEDYEFVALECIKIEFFGDCELARRERTGGKWSSHAHGGNCHICGAWMGYSVAFYHAPPIPTSARATREKARATLVEAKALEKEQ